MQRNLKLLPYWCACSLVALLLSSCSTSPPVKDVKASSDPLSAPVVAVAKIASAELTREIVLTGEFRPYQVIDLHAKVAGYLKKINVDVGDRIQAGQLIA